MRNTLQPRPPKPVVMAQVRAKDGEEAERWREAARQAGAPNFEAWVTGLVRREVERAEAK